MGFLEVGTTPGEGVVSILLVVSWAVVDVHKREPVQKGR